MKELWATGQSDFKGDFFQMDDCRCLPMPTGAPAKAPPYLFLLLGAESGTIVAHHDL